jgi:tRNA G18 (ribose-2'-O)-methylase SpoU
MLDAIRSMWLNIGTVVRNANAFLASHVHVIGNKKWNRRGAMVTDRYQRVSHREDLAAFKQAVEGLPIIGIDLLPGSVSLLETELPRECVLLFGQEGPGLSEEARSICQIVAHIPQFGSTRSINAGVASGIAMFEWVRRHAADPW